MYIIFRLHFEKLGFVSLLWLDLVKTIQLLGFAQRSELQPQRIEFPRSRKVPHRVIGSTGHIPHHHVGHWQDLAILGLLNKDSHPPSDKLTVKLDALGTGDELPVRVVPCRLIEQQVSSQYTRSPTGGSN